MQRAGRKNSILCLMPIVGGILCGWLIFRFFGGSLVKGGAFFGESFFEELQYIQIQKKEYLWYLIKLRGLQIGFLIIMEWMGRKEIGALIWAWMSGLGFGMTGYAMMKQWGYAGILGSVCMLLPHYLFYLVGYMRYMDNDCGGQYKTGKDRNKGKGIYQKIKVLGVVITGVLLECYVNPYFLKFFSKIFT